MLIMTLLSLSFLDDASENLGVDRRHLVGAIILPDDPRPATTLNRFFLNEPPLEDQPVFAVDALEPENSADLSAVTRRLAIWDAIEK